MAFSRKTSGFLMKELVFSFCLYVLTPRTDAAGFIMAKSCGNEIVQLDHVTFHPGSAVWMKIVKATYLFLGHGVVGTTSGPFLRSGDPRGNHCNMTPFKIMQVIASPDKKVHLKDPSSKKFLCSITNEALSLREATGYISCEVDMNDGELEIDNLINATDAFTSMLLNEEPKPAVTRSPRRERMSSASSFGFPVREKQKLQEVTTVENLLRSESLLQPDNTDNDTARLSFSANETLDIVKTNSTSLFRRVVETPQPRIISRDSVEALISTIAQPYESMRTERPTPKPSVHNGDFPESSTTVTNTLAFLLNSNYKPTAVFDVNDSLLDFSISEDTFESASLLPSETTMIFELKQESSLMENDEEPDVTAFWELDGLVPQSTIFDSVVETVTVDMDAATADMENESPIPQYDEILENTVFINAHHSYNTSSDDSQLREDQSSVIMPTSVLEPSNNIFVTVTKGASSQPKNVSLKKSTQAPVKGISTNEEIQNRIINFFSSLTNVYSYFKDAISHEQDSSAIPETSLKSLVNSTSNGENNIDKIPSVSLDIPTVSSAATKSFNILDEFPEQKSTKVSESETSPFIWPIPMNDTYLEPSEIDNSKLSNQNGNGIPNDILSYISKKSNNSLNASEDSSLPGSNSSASRRNHSISDALPLNSSFNSSYVKRLSDKLDSSAAVTNPAFTMTTRVSLSRDAGGLGVSEDVKSRESTKSQGNTWILLIGGGIALQIQLIIGLTIIWCCVRRKFQRYVDTDPPVNIYDGFSKVVNFRNSGKLSDETDKCSAHEGDENKIGSPSEANPELPKCLSTSL